MRFYGNEKILPLIPAATNVEGDEGQGSEGDEGQGSEGDAGQGSGAQACKFESYSGYNRFGSSNGRAGCKKESLPRTPPDNIAVRSFGQNPAQLWPKLTVLWEKQDSCTVF